MKERVIMHDTLRFQPALELDEIKNMTMGADQQKKALGKGLVSNFREGHNCWWALSRWDWTSKLGLHIFEMKKQICQLFFRAFMFQTKYT